MFIRYALSHDITTAIVGYSTPAKVLELAGTGMAAVPLTLAERREIMKLLIQDANRLVFSRG